MKGFIKRTSTVVFLYGMIMVFLHYEALWTEGKQTEDSERDTDKEGDVETQTEMLVKQHSQESFEKGPFQRPLPYDKHFKNPCWYADKGDLKCLPYFFIVGVRKCGTTQIWSYLLKHPEVLSPGLKENNIYGYDQLLLHDEPITEKRDRYIRYYEPVSRELEQLTNKTTGTNNYIFGEGSTAYMYVSRHWPRYPGNQGLREPKYVALDFVHGFLPDMKAIICFRNPTDRLYSEFYFTYGHLHNKNDLSPEMFHQLVEFAMELFYDCLRRNTVRGCVYNEVTRAVKEALKPKILLYLGIYYVYMEDLIRIYGRDNVLVLNIEDIENTSTLAEVFSFLNLTRLPEERLAEIIRDTTKINSRLDEFSRKGPMLDATRQLLNEFYRPYNKLMVELLNDNHFLYDDKARATDAPPIVTL